MCCKTKELNLTILDFLIRIRGLFKCVYKMTSKLSSPKGTSSFIKRKQSEVEKESVAPTSPLGYLLQPPLPLMG